MKTIGFEPAQASGAGLPSLDPRQLPELVADGQTCSQKCGRTTLLATSLPFGYKFPFCRQFGMALPIRQNTRDIKQFDDLAAKSADGRLSLFPPNATRSGQDRRSPRKLAGGPASTLDPAPHAGGDPVALSGSGPGTSLRRDYRRGPITPHRRPRTSQRVSECACRPYPWRSWQHPRWRPGRWPK